jgi:hypothetical protein
VSALQKGIRGYPAKNKVCGIQPFVKAIEANNTLEAVITDILKHLTFCGDTTISNRKRCLRSEWGTCLVEASNIGEPCYHFKMWYAMVSVQGILF